MSLRGNCHDNAVDESFFQFTWWPSVHHHFQRSSSRLFSRPSLRSAELPRMTWLRTSQGGSRTGRSLRTLTTASARTGLPYAQAEQQVRPATRAHAARGPEALAGVGASTLSRRGGEGRRRTRWM